eukprot:2344754-Rhodomonas_salina.6
MFWRVAVVQVERHLRDQLLVLKQFTDSEKDAEHCKSKLDQEVEALRAAAARDKEQLETAKGKAEEQARRLQLLAEGTVNSRLEYEKSIAGYGYPDNVRHRHAELTTECAWQVPNREQSHG